MVMYKKYFSEQYNVPIENIDVKYPIGTEVAMNLIGFQRNSKGFVRKFP